MCDYDKWYSGVTFIAIGTTLLFTVAFIKAAAKLAEREDRIKEIVVIQNMTKS